MTSIIDTETETSFPVDDYKPKTMDQIIDEVKSKDPGYNFVSLFEVKVKPELLPDLFNAIKNNEYIKYISLYKGVVIDKNLANQIAEIMQDGRTIDMLDLGGCNIDDESMSNIIYALQKAKIHEILLDGNQISEENIIKIIAIAKQNKNITIFISENDLSEEVLELIHHNPDLSNIIIIEDVCTDPYMIDSDDDVINELLPFFNETENPEFL